MRPNLGREGRDPEELGQCPNFHRIYFLKASLSGPLLIMTFPHSSFFLHALLFMHFGGIQETRISVSHHIDFMPHSAL